MANFTKQQAQEMFKKAESQGVSRDVVFKRAVEQGHSFEGLDTEKVMAELSGKQQPMANGDSEIPAFVRGVGKSAAELLQGAGTLGQTIAEKTAGKLVEKITGTPAENLGVDAYRKGTPEYENIQNAIQPQGTGESVGKFVGDVAQFAIPSTKAVKAVQGGNVVKALVRAGTSGGVAAVREGEVGKDAAIAAGTDLAFSGAGAALQPVKRLIGRLLKGTSSALSGAPVSQIDDILKNPTVAKDIASKESAVVLRDNVNTIANGVQTIKQQARATFGKGLSELAETDIKPDVFRSQTQTVLDKYGSKLVNGKRVLENVEFDDPKNIKKASELVDRLANVKLDGKSLRKLADDIENAAYKTATSDERLAYNAFVKDLSGQLRKAVTSSTDKLKEINAQFSSDMKIAQAMEGIFGKVQFKDTNELNKISQRLESLSNQKGMSPEILDDFLNRIGIEPADFRAGESSRQIGNLSQQSNTVGANPFEVIRSATSSIVTPKMVRDIAIKTGLAKEPVAQFLNSVEPTVRASFLKLILGLSDESQ
jgi:hypothetical protein